MLRNPLGWIQEELDALEASGLRRRPATRRGPQGVRLHVEGRELINFGANDYLGLAADPRIVEAASQAARVEGWGGGASPLVTGRSTMHAELERRLARFEGAEAAIVFSSGFAANVGTIAALVGRGDCVFCDKNNHASIIDGCRLSGARMRVYAHRDCRQLERRLAGAGAAGRRLIVTDSLFSMDGDLAPLAELADLARRYEAMLMVDEAHATGVFGRQGRGVCELLGVEGRANVRMGTLSKALGSAGGFVTGPRPLVEWLANRARPYVFSTAPPPAVCAAALAAIDVVQREPHRRAELLGRAADLRERLRGQGWDLGDSQSQIIPIGVGRADAAMRLAAALRDRGLLTPPIRPPSVPRGRSLLRISLSYAHTEEMIDRLATALGRLRDRGDV